MNAPALIQQVLSGHTVEVLTLAAVALCAVTGVLEAGRKSFDLFGMVVVALVAALGGGTLRDLLLGLPVFWVANPDSLVAAALAGLAAFAAARLIHLPANAFLVPDAAGLALFTVLGTEKALAAGVPWLTATLMGVITGVFGGILRDVLCNEEPLVFRGELYATACWAGALLLVALRAAGVEPPWGAVAAMALVFLLRLAALRWKLGLPRYSARQ